MNALLINDTTSRYRTSKAGIIFLLISFSAFTLHAQYNVKDFGARGDSVTLDTRAIQLAIDKAYENRGGKVYFPAGIYQVSGLILKDNIELHLENGAVLLGSPDYKDYQEVHQKFESRTKDLYAKYFMIFAENARNISITGSGTIYGNGDKHYAEARPQHIRPFMIRLVNCEQVTLRDVRLLESANWTLHILACRDVHIDGIEIETRGEGNRDGLDIDASQRVAVSNSRFSTTDDAIVLKASADVLCQDIVINNCIVRSIGGSGVKTGTESNGGFRNITVSNCVLKDIPIHAGIELITVDGGMLENVLVENIAMENVGTPFFIRLGKRARPYKKGQYVKKIDDVKDVFLNHISVKNAKLPSSIIGLRSNRIKNVSIQNYTVRYNESQEPRAYNDIGFQEFDYPAANAFSRLPAYALYCRSAENIYLQNITVYSSEKEKRTPFVFDEVKNLELFAVKAEVKNRLMPMIYLRNSRNIISSFCRSLDTCKTLFEAEGNTANDLNLFASHLYPGQKELSRNQNQPSNQVFEDFATAIKYSVASGVKKERLPAHALKNNPLKINLNAKKGALQLCLLVVTDSQRPEKIILKYNGITQEFQVNWNTWGWAPISLLKEYDENQQIEFEISGEHANNQLNIAKVYLRYHDIGFTD